MVFLRRGRTIWKDHLRTMQKIITEMKLFLHNFIDHPPMYIYANFCVDACMQIHRGANLHTVADGHFSDEGFKV